MGGNGYCHCGTWDRRIAELEAENAELRKDKARLEFILARVDEFDFGDIALTDPETVNPTPRHFVDIAIEERGGSRTTG